MSAGVIMANIIWNIMNTKCGMLPAMSGFGAPPTPASPTQDSPPIQAFPGANASEYPSIAHCTVISPSAMKLILMVLMALLSLTSPP